MSKNIINDPVYIFLITDSNNLINLRMTISMLIEKSSLNRMYHIYILYNHLNKKIIKDIENFFTKENIKLLFYKCNEKEFISSLPEDTPHKSKVARFKFLIGKFQISKALYIDTDILIRKDVAELFDIDLKGYILAAVPDVNYKSFNKNLKLHKNYIYFNSGVLLIDCNKWKNFEISEQLLNCATLNESIIKFVDQDTFNIVFSKIGYLKLDLSWNLPSAHQYLKFNYVTYYNIFKNSYNCIQILRSILAPNIVHFIGIPKPSENNVKSAFSKDYIKYYVFQKNCLKSTRIYAKYCQIYTGR